MNSEGTKCSVKGCTKDATIWRCDACYRHVCGDHHFLMDLIPKEQVPVILDEALKAGVTTVNQNPMKSY